MDAREVDRLRHRSPIGSQKDLARENSERNVSEGTDGLLDATLLACILDTAGRECTSGYHLLTKSEKARFLLSSAPSTLNGEVCPEVVSPRSMGSSTGSRL